MRLQSSVLAILFLMKMAIRHEAIRRYCSISPNLLIPCLSMPGNAKTAILNLEFGKSSLPNGLLIVCARTKTHKQTIPIVQCFLADTQLRNYWTYVCFSCLKASNFNVQVKMRKKWNSTIWSIGEDAVPCNLVKHTENRNQIVTVEEMK